ncbi:L-type lectin-domain containing receptor kinase IX.1-like [Euphorbia lathyris]|uniref:L-type lectin-domain containing receptor kinase IX.1-like n=1 Tax=Euphorbia lathyris TaxID=212925 RepID=UPI0033143D0E
MRSPHTSMLMAIIIFLMLLLPLATSISFNFTRFNPNMGDISFDGDAFSANNVLQLTKNAQDSNLESSTGRASYRYPVRLWDAKSKKLTDFTTHFSFTMKAVNPQQVGDGMSFFLAPIDSRIPDDSSGGFLALFSPATAFTSSKLNQIVAVEFDSFGNTWDPTANHVGIDVNSIVSVANLTWKGDMKNGTEGNAWITYNSTTKNLSVFLTYSKNPVFNGSFSLSYIIDLREFLPEWVKIGFSASTGSWVELHNVNSWDFSSTLEIDKKARTQTGLFIAVGLAVGSVVVMSAGICVFWRRKFVLRREEHDPVDVSMDDEFERGTGPKRFTYRELNRATNDFTEAGKLGEGGFGGVYKGLLTDSKTEIAVKKVSRGSKQGKKEYVSEVKIISRLRHRNLVQLIGWCHERGELLLVYEYMPNGSLDSHLFGRGKTSLIWSIRYKIALGLASALLYLHEEWEQCVVHRDIKSSNIMLDSNFNAKLGDFGLARLVDHDLGSQTTVLAGTMGYLAPECVTTGKASKESDVYSFGVVALEIACGRKPVDIREEAGRVRLIEWVWDLYGKGQLVEALDSRLIGQFDERQLECLMIVGLWCCHPDFVHRPSIKQVINVLSFEASLPTLPAKLPVPMYYAPPMNMCKFTYTSTTTGSTCSTTNSSILSGGSTKSLLKSERATDYLNQRI